MCVTLDEHQSLPPIGLKLDREGSAREAGGSEIPQECVDDLRVGVRRSQDEFATPKYGACVRHASVQDLVHPTSLPRPVPGRAALIGRTRWRSQYRLPRISDAVVPQSGVRSDLSADEGKERVLGVGIGSRLQLRAEEARCPEAPVDGLQVCVGHGTGFSIEAIIGTDGSGEVPRMHQQISDRESEALPGRHLAEREGHDLIQCSGCTERLVGSRPDCVPDLYEVIAFAIDIPPGAECLRYESL